MQERDLLLAELAELEKEFVSQVIIANSLKTATNGTFGKLGSMFSKIYTPDLMLAITLSGQFYLLALIEDLLAYDVEIISANTDGVCFGGKPGAVKAAMDWIECYGFLTGFEFEFTRYRKIALRDVNTYCAIKTDGKAKTKGGFAMSGLMKNPTNEVCTLAAQAYLATGRSIESFIREHLKVENFADFTQSRNVKGGGVRYARFEHADDWVAVGDGEWHRASWPETRATLKRKSRPPPVLAGVDPVYLGRTVRWYYSTAQGLSINYATTGNLVPKSEGGMPCMTLPDSIPDDLDIDRYVEEARAMLRSAGVPC